MIGLNNVKQDAEKECEKIKKDNLKFNKLIGSNSNLSLTNNISEKYDEINSSRK